MNVKKNYMKSLILLEIEKNMADTKQKLTK